MLRNILGVALGGAAGATCRYVITLSVERMWGFPYPLAILTVNVLGCALLGVVGTCLALQEGVSPHMQILITTGFLGAFTTYSTYAADTVRLWDAGQSTWAAVYVVAHVGLGVGAVRFGGWLAQSWLARA